MPLLWGVCGGGVLQDAVAFRAFGQANILTMGADHFEVCGLLCSDEAAGWGASGAAH